MLDSGRIGARLVAQAAPGVPVAAFVRGRTPDEVLDLLPRLFNLCRAAQGAAVAAALGRPVDTSGIASDILRDHLLKFLVTWPGSIGCSPQPFPSGWAAGGPALLQALFGDSSVAPATRIEFERFLGGGSPLAAPLRAIRSAFAPGEAVALALPEVTPANIFADRRIENSVAARHAGHPVMQAIEAEHGRGPLWRSAARLYDIEAAAQGRLPAVQSGEGWAMVPAARGGYAVRLTLSGGRVESLDRVTPTDALLAPDGLLDQSLATLPPAKAGLGALLLDILDPCSPVRLKEARDA
ncbi:hydrogenase expression/formation protein HupK [Mesobacterium pallidum]|uniref:hydrogenase expression/formation protein HupK n=1 Tax=Mesobacterium pallidum TaxID=2872037 RepID=UPI001EE38859|nr:hydrogenase expression/formation protein HupK [Mesobacterium pallidum]